MHRSKTRRFRSRKLVVSQRNGVSWKRSGKPLQNHVPWSRTTQRTLVLDGLREPLPQVDCALLLAAVAVGAAAALAPLVVLDVAQQLEHDRHANGGIGALQSVVEM